MGVIKTNSTILGGLTPACNDCGIAMCWDISEEDYDSDKSFWDKWLCKDCLLIQRLNSCSIEYLKNKYDLKFIKTLINRVSDKTIKHKLIELANNY